MAFDHPGHFLPHESKGRYPDFLIGTPSGYNYYYSSDDKVTKVKLKEEVVVVILTEGPYSLIWDPNHNGTHTTFLLCKI
jgi:hypothetical protein